MTELQNSRSSFANFEFAEFVEQQLPSLKLFQPEETEV